jgi:hypothetical protein
MSMGPTSVRIAPAAGIPRALETGWFALPSGELARPASGSGEFARPALGSC